MHFQIHISSDDLKMMVQDVAYDDDDSCICDDGGMVDKDTFLNIMQNTSWY